MPILRVIAFRTELFTVEAFGRASSAEAAEKAFFATLEGEGSVLRWIDGYGGSHTEIDAIEDVIDKHTPQSIGDPPACGLCGRPVRSTAVPAERSLDRRTIPGSWIHEPGPTVAQGIGL